METFLLLMVMLSNTAFTIVLIHMVRLQMRHYRDTEATEHTKRFLADPENTGFLKYMSKKKSSMAMKVLTRDVAKDLKQFAWCNHMRGRSLISKW